MIMHKIYYKQSKYSASGLQVRFEGWFLFGFIPIYCRQLSYIQKAESAY